MLDLRKIFGRTFRSKVKNSLHFLPDKLYLQLFYFSTTRKFINFKNPTLFNEKQQWLKLNDKHPEYGRLVDKLAVREHIAETLGEEYLFPLLGQWKSFDDIDFSTLPERFVLKCNHDSGSTKIIKNKSAMTQDEITQLKKHFEARLANDFFRAGREYPYKGLPRYIIAEQLMTKDNEPDASIEDYKFFCFDGVPKVMFVATDRSTECKFDFFDMDFNLLDITYDHPHSQKPIPKPEKFEEMKEVAAKLSKGIRFVRIDLYELNGQIYFGEYTFFHGGGFQLFKPMEWEKRLGDWINLN